MEQYQDWLSGMPAKPLLSALQDFRPNDVDVDRDGMSDGRILVYPVESRRKYLGDESTYRIRCIQGFDRDSYDCDGDGHL